MVNAFYYNKLFRRNEKQIIKKNNNKIMIKKIIYLSN